LSRTPLYSHMRKSYLVAGLAIAIDVLAVGVLDAIVSLVYWLATGAKEAYLPVLSSLLFIEGGIILTIGCIIAFFHVRYTEGIYKTIMSPLKTLGINAEKEEREDPGEVGWLLIFLGTALIVLSIVASFEFLI
jgi:hypothetical protein